MIRTKPRPDTPTMIVLVLSSLLFGGCLGRSPQPHFYTLGSEMQAANAAASSELAILVGPIRFPRYLERPQFVRRLPGGEVELDEFNRWIGSFEDNVSRALAYDMATRLASTRVVAYPSDPPFELDYRIRIHFDELVVGSDDILRMRARWAIVPAAASRGHLVGVELGRTDLDQAVQGGSVTSIVEAHDQAIGVLSDAITIAIEGLESSRTASASDEASP